MDYAPRSMPLAERLLRRRRVTKAGCWEWTGAKVRGYGTVGDPVLRRVVRVHRAAWTIWRGPIPDGLCVLHRCDNPSCFNPEHLRLGTQRDNIADMDAKGRRRFNGVRGEAVCGARLTEDAVRSIRADTRTAEELARIYGVSPITVRRARTRKTWKHVL